MTLSASRSPNPSQTRPPVGTCHPSDHDPKVASFDDAASTMSAVSATLQHVLDLVSASAPSGSPTTWAPPRGFAAEDPGETTDGQRPADPVQAPHFDPDDALAMRPLELPKLDTTLFRNAGLTQYLPDLLGRQVELLKTTTAGDQFSAAIYVLDRLLDLMPKTVNSIAGTRSKDLLGSMRHDRTLDADKRRKTAAQLSAQLAYGRTVEQLLAPENHARPLLEHLWSQATPLLDLVMSQLSARGEVERIDELRTLIAKAAVLATSTDHDAIRKAVSTLAPRQLQRALGDAGIAATMPALVPLPPHLVRLAGRHPGTDVQALEQRLQDDMAWVDDCTARLTTLTDTPPLVREVTDAREACLPVFDAMLGVMRDLHLTLRALYPNVTLEIPGLNKKMAEYREAIHDVSPEGLSLSNPDELPLAVCHRANLALLNGLGGLRATVAALKAMREELPPPDPETIRATMAQAAAAAAAAEEALRTQDPPPPPPKDNRDEPADAEYEPAREAEAAPATAQTPSDAPRAPATAQASPGIGASETQPRTRGRPAVTRAPVDTRPPPANFNFVPLESSALALNAMKGRSQLADAVSLSEIGDRLLGDGLARLGYAGRDALMQAVLDHLRPRTDRGHALSFNAIHGLLRLANASQPSELRAEFATAVCENLRLKPHTEAEQRAFNRFVLNGGLELVQQLVTMPWDAAAAACEHLAPFALQAAERIEPGKFRDKHQRGDLPNPIRALLARRLWALSRVAHDPNARALGGAIAQLHGHTLPDTVRDCGDPAAWLRHAIAVFKGEAVTDPYAIHRRVLKINAHDVGVPILRELLRETLPAANSPGVPQVRKIEIVVGSQSHASLGATTLRSVVSQAAEANHWDCEEHPDGVRLILTRPRNPERSAP